MKKILASLLLLTVASYGQIPADSLFNLIKRESIHRKKADWNKIDLEFRANLKTSKTETDSLHAIVQIFSQLNDYHSNINYKNQTYSNYPSFDEQQLKYLMPLVNLSNQNAGIFKKKVLQNKILYLQIPSIYASGNDVNLIAKQLSDSLCSTDFSKIKGMILDLRLNGGGQFAAMAGGIAKLYKNGYVGGGMDANNKLSYRFSIKDDNLWINDNAATNIKQNCNTDLSNIPIAVVIGPNTRSSGTILGLTLKGREKTIFVGEATATGYTTGNNYFSYGNLHLNLATSNSVDRDNVIYESSLQPDIIVTGEDNFEKPELDTKVRKATEWLKNNFH